MSRDIQHYRQLLDTIPDASVGATLVAAMVYAARHGACDHADRSTEEYKTIARALLTKYGDTLSRTEAREIFAQALDKEGKR